MSSLSTAGAIGWLILLLGIVLVVVGAVFAKNRAPRIAAVALLLACAIPFGLGIIGLVASQMAAFETVESVAAPTPADLSRSVSAGTRCFVLGLGATLLGGAAALAALARSLPETRTPAAE